MAHWRLPSAALAVALPLISAAVIGAADERAVPRTPALPATDAARGDSLLSALPAAFEPSEGGFRARGAGYDLFLDRSGSTLVLRRGANRRPVTLRSRLVGARVVTPRSESRLPGIVNVYRGRRSDWRERIPTYRRVRYASVYPGVDAVYHGRQAALEYDFEVQPGASPSQIALSHVGARSTSIARNGDLLHRVRDGVVRERRPVAYQVIDGRRVRVDVSFALAGNRVGFEVGSYDRTRELVIDPILSYSSYLGGSNEDYPTKLAVGTDKSIYITGRTLSNDFPGGSRDSGRIDVDAFVTKLSADGSRVYTTYVGTTGLDQAFDVAADSSGRAYIVGNTDSPDFTPYLLDSCADGGTDAFILRLNADGSRGTSSCLGGDGFDTASSVAIREVGGTPEAYIVGQMSQGFGTYPSPGPNGYQTTCCTGGMAAFFARVSFGSTVTIPYLTYIDGSSTDYGRAVAVDPSGNAYVAGRSVSTSIGGTAKPGASDGVYVMKLNPGTTGAASKVYSTWIDGSSTEDVGSPDSPPYLPGSIAVNGSGVAYVAGNTGSSNLPAKVTSDTFKYVSGDAGYISVIGSDGSVARTLYVDGAGATRLLDVAIQDIGGVTSVYAIGETDGTLGGLNTISGQSCAATSAFHPDAVLVKIADGATPQGVFLTCLGGSGDDTGTAIAPELGSSAAAWIIGTTTGSFPTVDPKQAGSNGATEGFLARVAQHPAVIDSGPDASIATRSATFTFSTGGSGLTFACSVSEGGRLVRGGALGPCSGSGSASYGDLADGEHTFEVATVDAAGAQSARASRTFTVNTAAPSAAYVIAPNPVLLGRPASFDASSSRPASEPIARYEWDLDGDGSFETDTGGSPTTTKTYGAGGTVNTALRVTDTTGASGVARVPLVITDPNSRASQVGVTINRGAQYTNKPDVTLSIVFPAATTAMLISNDGGFLAPLQTGPATSVAWKLDSSGPERLPKTVYLRFLTGPIASANFTDDIILDERAPVVDSASLAGPARAAVAARTRTWRVKVKARDSNSGVGHVQVTANKRKPGKLIAYRRAVKVKASARPRFLRARDRAGNYSRWKKLR